MAVYGDVHRKNGDFSYLCYVRLPEHISDPQLTNNSLNKNKLLDWSCLKKKTTDQPDEKFGQDWLSQVPPH